MPVLVVGADTPVGKAAISTMTPTASEVRAFASDPTVAEELRDMGATVAIGDISDASHLAGAALGAFSAVLVAAAATDGRETAFASGATEVYDAWVEAVRDAGIRRVIWVGGSPPPELARLDVELARVDAGGAPDDIAARVASLDDVEHL